MIKCPSSVVSRLHFLPMRHRDDQSAINTLHHFLTIHDSTLFTGTGLGPVPSVHLFSSATSLTKTGPGWVISNSEAKVKVVNDKH